MAENLQTTRPADEGWTTVIRPRTGWFDIDLQELWRYRDLIMMFVKRNFTVLYKQTILGPAWIILNPLITTVIFNVVFGGMANMPTDGVPGFLFYMAGNTVWTFFANCVNNTANTFVTNSQIFGKVYFPRLTMPVSQVLTSLINFGIQAAMYLIFWVYFFATGSGVTFTLWVLAVPFVVLEVMLLGLGVGITHPVDLGPAEPGKIYTSVFEFDPSLLGEGQYFFYLDIFDGALAHAVCLDKPVTEFAFEVTNSDLTMPEWASGWGRIHFPPVKLVQE